jgi:integrase
LWHDVDGPTVEKFIADGRGDNGYGQGTHNAYLRAFKTFTKWLKDERDLTPDPMSRIKLLKQTEYRKKRRPLNTDELSRLLTKTKNGECRGNMSGFERYLTYRIATECGLRYSEIKALKVLSFDLNPCTVHVEAENSKGKESADLILNDETAVEIKAFLAGKEPTERAFNLPHNSHAAEMIRADLATAGIEFRDAAGRDIDFHSTRGTFITNLFLAGVPAAIVQKLVRHKDLKTTQGYCHISFESEVAAIRKLRDLTVTCQSDAQQKTTVDSSGMKNSVDEPEIALSA